MKKQFGAWLTLIIVSCWLGSSLHAGLLEGTTSGIVVVDTQQTFDATTTGADGFVWLRAGFTIDSALSEATMKIAAPVMGTMDLNSKTLVLQSDLYLDSSATFSSNNGTIKGGGYTMHLGGGLTTSNTLTISTSALTIDGHGNTWTDGQFSLNASQTLTLRNMTLDNVDGSTFSLGSGSTLILDNVTLNMNNTVTFSDGHVTVAGKTRFRCGGAATARTITFSSGGNFTIDSYALCVLDHGITFSHNNASTTNFVFTDNTSSLYLCGSTLESLHANGITLKKGALIVGHKGTMEGDITCTNSGADEMEIIFMPSATLHTASGDQTIS